MPNLSIIFGHFLSHVVSMPLANPNPGKVQYASVIKTEEKGSDVNIATHLLHDGYQGAYGVAIVMSNDSDLVDAIRIVRNELKKGVIVLNPFKDTPSVELSRVATFVKPIRQGLLAASQFPVSMQDQNGAFHKPPKW